MKRIDSNHYSSYRSTEDSSNKSEYLRTFYARIKVRLQDYFSNLESRIRHDPTLEAEDVILIQKINRILSQNFSDPQFKVEELGRTLAISPSMLFRKLEKTVNTTPGKYIRLYRLYKAKELLENSKKSVGAITYETGFTDQAHFSRAFKNVFNCTPKQHRKRFFDENSQNNDEN